MVQHDNKSPKRYVTKSAAPVTVIPLPKELPVTGTCTSVSL